MWNTVDCNMIVIEGNSASEYYAEYCKPSWEHVGIKVNYFTAVTPTTLYKNNQLKFARYSSAMKYTSKQIKAPITDTEMSCWYSHFLLWQECCYNNRPMLILEHDSYLEHPENLWYDSSYGVIFYDKAAMGSYIIQPAFAKQLVDYAMGGTISNGPYATIYMLGHDRPPMRKLIVNSSHELYRAASNQVMSSRFGNTIQHYCNDHPHHWPSELFHKFKEIE